MRGSGEKVRLSRGKRKTWLFLVTRKLYRLLKATATCFYTSRSLLSGRLSGVLSSLLSQMHSLARVVSWKKMRSYSRNNASYFWNFTRRIPVISRIKYFCNQLFLFVSRILLRKERERELLQFSILRSLRLHDSGTLYLVIRDACKDVESRSVAALNGPLDLVDIHSGDSWRCREFTFHGNSGNSVNCENAYWFLSVPGYRDSGRLGGCWSLMERRLTATC